jgi:hypothetical protein
MATISARSLSCTENSSISSQGSHQGVQEKKTKTKITTFELSAKKHPYIPVSTTKILSDYTRDPPPDIPDSVLRQRRDAKREHTETVEQLKRWAIHGETSYGKIHQCLSWLLPTGRSILKPNEQKILSVVDHFFPPRCEILVSVCDFGDGRAECKEVRLGDIEVGECI